MKDDDFCSLTADALRVWFVQKLIEFCIKRIDSALKIMNSVLQMMNSVLGSGIYLPHRTRMQSPNPVGRRKCFYFP